MTGAAPEAVAIRLVALVAVAHPAVPLDRYQDAGAELRLPHGSALTNVTAYRWYRAH